MPNKQRQNKRSKNGAAESPRVIVISGNHDEVTGVLHGYATSYVRGAGSNGTVHVKDENAIGIQQAFRTYPKAALFFFLHGRDKPPGVTVGKLEEEVVGKRTISLLKSRIICGTCYSLNGFAQLAMAQKCTVIGYDGVMIVPTKEKRAREMRKAALAAHSALKVNENAATATELARNAYQELSDRWYAEAGAFEGQFLGAVASANAQAIGLKGSGKARLPKPK
jgi:hypothetical protein